MPSVGNRYDSRWVHLVLVRVDDRLLHGQVVLHWVRALRPECIVIADDALATDMAGCAALSGAAPPGIRVWVGGIHEAMQELRRDEHDGTRTMVLVPEPVSARRLFDDGVGYGRLNVGAVGLAAGRVRVGRQVCLSRDEWEALRYLEQAGVEVTIQPLPSDAPIAFARVRRPREWGRQSG